MDQQIRSAPNPLHTDASVARHAMPCHVVYVSGGECALLLALQRGCVQSTRVRRRRLEPRALEPCWTPDPYQPGTLLDTRSATNLRLMRSHAMLSF